MHSNKGPHLGYAAYDKTTGRIVHTHSRFSVPENRFVEMPIEELKKRFSSDMHVVSKLSDKDPKNLEFIKIDLGDIGPATGGLMVDTAKKKLVKRPSLALTASKREIAGDGKDTATIDIAVVDAHGKHIDGASGTAKVTTTRGKLSARGGIVKLAKGHAKVTLTSANETVSKVRVSVISPDKSFGSAYLDVEFV